MTKAEEAALRAYPEGTGEDNEFDTQFMQDFVLLYKIKRRTYQEGYEQAQKDLADEARWSSGPDGFFYGKGYEAAQKDLGWVSVKERLPEKEGDVLAYRIEDDSLCISYYLADKKRFCDDYNGIIDYWMPIPELPKEVI